MLRFGAVSFQLTMPKIVTLQSSCLKLRIKSTVQKQIYTQVFIGSQRQSAKINSDKSCISPLRASQQLTPDAVRTGLAFSLGKRAFLCAAGTAAMISTSFGWLGKPYLLAVRPLILDLANTAGQICQSTSNSHSDNRIQIMQTDIGGRGSREREREIN